MYHAHLKMAYFAAVWTQKGGGGGNRCTYAGIPGVRPIGIQDVRKRMLGGPRGGWESKR